MANYYTDIPELKYHLNNPMMKRICELKERNYRDKDEFDYAPLDFEDAVDSYDKVLEITGEITGEIIAANAEGVDEEGPHCANGRVEYASGTKQNLDAMVKAGLNGMTMPRQFGGLNFPITPYTMCAEIVAAADAGTTAAAGSGHCAALDGDVLTRHLAGHGMIADSQGDGGVITCCTDGIRQGRVSGFIDKSYICALFRQSDSR